MATLKEQDIVLHTTDSSGNPVIQLPVTRLENVEGQDSKLVHTTGNETVAGTKTFSSSPIAPTPTAGDNSTKVATTAFVTTVGNAKAPTSHASTATIYGIGTGSNYGHVKLSDSTSSTSAASAGIAASPKAVKAAYDLANTAKTNAAMAQTTADACLPLSGGTMTGKLGFTASNHVFINLPNGYLRLWGGKVDDGIMGGNITLFGGKHETGWGTGAGGIIIEANNGSTSNALKLSTDGSLLWAGHTARHYLKHSTATNVAVNGTEVTIPYDGLLYVWLQRGNSGLGKVIVKINDYTMPTLSSNNYSWCTCPYPVEKGQVVTITQEGVSLCGAKLYAFK